jgi:predicted phage terminase large subunit-like protein
MTTQLAGRNVTDIICRIDFASFIRKCFQTLEPNSEFLPNWHIYALAYRLEQVWRGKVKRLNVNFPPRTLKSFICSVVFPAFILGHDPTKRVIVLCYSLELAIKLSNDFRAIINSPWYRSLFPETRISRTKNTEFEVVTTRNGFRLGTSIDGSVTGRGGDFIIIDDPLKPMDALSDSKRQWVNDLYNTTLHTRLDNKQSGAIIVVMQRLDTDDLAGTLQHSTENWLTLSLPAIAEREERIQIGEHAYHVRRVGDVLHPEREPLESLEATRSQMGSYSFAAQFQQAPFSRHGSIINPEWICRYDQLPDRTSSSTIMQSWDTASKVGELNDYSACATLLFHNRKIYVVDMLRDRFDFPTLRTRAIAHARAHRANTILIEEAGVGIALVPELKNALLPAIAIKPQYDKKIRMSIQSRKFEDGTVLLPKQASWLADFEDELFRFPHTRHDDQVDAISQALAYEVVAEYDFGKIAAGMGKFCSGLAFQQNFRGRIV